MNDLSAELRSVAAELEPSRLDVDAVWTRAHRKRRRQRGVLSTLIVLLVVMVIGVGIAIGRSGVESSGLANPNPNAPTTPRRHCPVDPVYRGEDGYSECQREMAQVWLTDHDPAEVAELGSMTPGSVSSGDEALSVLSNLEYRNACRVTNAALELEQAAAPGHNPDVPDLMAGLVARVRERQPAGDQSGDIYESLGEKLAAGDLDSVARYVSSSCADVIN